MIRFLLAAILLNCSTAFALDNFNETAKFTSLSFQLPSDAVLPAEKLYVVDSDKNALMIFTPGLTSPQIVGSKGKGSEQFSRPLAIAVGRDGRVFVADSGNNRIQVLSPEGKFLFSFGSGGSNPGQFSDISDLAFSPDSRLFVADSGNSRIQFFSEDGIFEGFYKTQTDIDALETDASGSVYYLYEKKLTKLSSSGEQLFQFPVLGEKFCVDSHGAIYTLEAKKGKIRIYSPAGVMTGEFGTTGQGNGQFSKPTNLIARGGSIMVVDAGNRKVSVIDIEDSTRQAALPPPSETRVNIAGPATELPLDLSVFAIDDDSNIGGYSPAKKEFALFDKTGKQLQKVGASGKAPGEYREPAGLNWNKARGWLLSDTENDRLSVFTTAGKFDSTIGEKTKGAGKEGVLDTPSGTDINEQGQILVADTGKARLVKYNAAGMFMGAYGPKIGALTLSRPIAAAWAAGGSMLVLDAGLRKVLLIDQAGQLTTAWGGEGNELWQFKEPVGMVYDGKKFVYILDRKAAAVKAYDLSGKFLAAFFSPGNGRTELTEPSALSYKNDKLYIAEPKRGRLSAYAMQINVAPPQDIQASAHEDRALLSWKNPADGLVTGYVLYRSTEAGLNYAEAGKTITPSFEEPLAEQGGTYYYRIAAQSRTGAISVPSREIQLFVPGIPKPETLEIAKVNIDHLFSAGYKYYVNNPVGTITIVNNTGKNIMNAKVSFFLKDYTDFPYDTVVRKINVGEQVEVSLKATLNNKVLQISEDTPIQAQFSVSYNDNGAEKTQTLNRPITILSRTAIVWDDASRIASFITPNDPPVRQLVAYVLPLVDKQPDLALADSLRKVIMVWNAASEMGISYLSDPTSPYTEIKANQSQPIDRVQFPRDTMKLKTGDCDDLTALMATMLEGVGVQTAIMDYPSHIALMVNTGYNNSMQLGLPYHRLIQYNDSLWIPLELTMLGKTFDASIAQAAATYKQAKGEVKIIDTRKAGKTFEAVTLPETEWTAARPAEAALLARYSADSQKMAKIRFNYLSATYEDTLKKNPDDASAMNGLAILYIERGDLEKGKEYLNKVLAKNPAEPAALNNLGNLSYDTGHYEAAADYYNKASAADPYDSGVWLNRARTALKLKNTAEAAEFVAKAASIDPSIQEIGDQLLQQD